MSSSSQSGPRIWPRPSAYAPAARFGSGAPPDAGGARFVGVASTYRFDAQGDLRGWATVYEIQRRRAIFRAKLTDPVEG